MTKIKKPYKTERDIIEDDRSLESWSEHSEKRITKERNKMTFRHPELKEGEILIGNGDQDYYNNLKWKTKRLGNIAYRVEPFYRKEYDKVEIIIGAFPIFIQEKEFDETLDNKTKLISDKFDKATAILISNPKKKVSDIMKIIRNK